MSRPNLRLLRFKLGALVRHLQFFDRFQSIFFGLTCPGLLAKTGFSTLFGSLVHYAFNVAQNFAKRLLLVPCHAACRSQLDNQALVPPVTTSSARAMLFFSVRRCEVQLNNYADVWEVDAVARQIRRHQTPYSEFPIFLKAWRHSSRGIKPLSATELSFTCLICLRI